MTLTQRAKEIQQIPVHALFVFSSPLPPLFTPQNHLTDLSAAILSSFLEPLSLQCTKPDITSVMELRYVPFNLSRLVKS